MGKFSIILVFLFSAISLVAQQPAADDAAGDTVSQQVKDYGRQDRQSLDELWDKANTAYVNAAYPQAIALYDSLLDCGAVSYKLYYNLGNAYFKSGEIGRSILYYNKAQRLSPTDNDIKHNLAVVNTYVKDKIEQVPEFFVNRWMRSLRMSLGSNTWTLISVLLLAASVAAGLLYLLSSGLGRRKAGFYIMAFCAMLFIVSTIFAVVSHREAVAPDQAIIMHTAVSVKSSPDRSSKDLFVIHEGTRVRVVGELQQWREIVLADGNKGWIEVSSIEMI